MWSLSTADSIEGNIIQLRGTELVKNCNPWYCKSVYSETVDQRKKTLYPRYTAWVVEHLRVWY